MTNFSAKTAALTALITLGSLMSTSAHAAIVRSSDGSPVLTKDGNCVINNWEGSEDCAAAKGGPAAQEVEHDLEKTVYFDFNKSTLTPEAKRRLDHLAKKLVGVMDKHHHHRHNPGPTITIVGFADRIGNSAYNDKLAMKRAESVRAYLVAKGVKTRKIEVRSLGKTEPKAECPADLPRAKLIRCLREDRRVEIEVDAPK